ncbi:unnamed protein product [Brachionus calyciflorus]|uniref:EF-hand domain-containing protein n=1 Tax=Brachionus calyciflorus TaxID=104777 RepID=A0A813M3K9_9BILA|nr:unnamed protein product [Brachionus calyciflorus]
MSKSIGSNESHQSKNKSINSLDGSLKFMREDSLADPVVINPFVHSPKLNPCEKFQLIIGGILLLPIRLIMISFTVFLAIIFGFVMTIGLSQEDLQHKPLNGWRKRARGILRFLGRALAFFFGFHSIKKFGQRSTRQQCTIFVAAPHTSYFDAFLFFILGLPTAISRAENGNLPIIGRVVRAVQPILVNREDAKDKNKTTNNIILRADPQGDWPQLLIFPEGTTTNGNCLITFKPGAFSPGLAVQPVLVKYKNRINTITWTWQGYSAYKVTLLTLCQFNNNMEVHYLPVYEPNDTEKENKILFANNVRAEMARHLKVATTNHSYEDCQLMIQAKKLNLPFESAIIEFFQIKKKLNINFENCDSLLKDFAQYARKNDGKMTLKEFCNYLHLDENDETTKVFDLYDRNKDGKIDFREFLIGLSLISRPSNNKENIKQAFDSFTSVDENEILRMDGFKSFMHAIDSSISDEETKHLFEKIDYKKAGSITFDECYSYLNKSSKYSKYVDKLLELKILNNNIEYTNAISKNNSSIDKISYSSNVTKRPLSNKSRSEETKVEEIKPIKVNSNENVSPKSNEHKIE